MPADPEPGLTREERVARGKAARRAVPLDAHATLAVDAARDPVGVLIEQERTRVPELVPILWVPETRSGTR